MKIKGLIADDFCNYKKPSMYIAFPECSFKCDQECGSAVCQNSKLAQDPCIEVDIKQIVNHYIENPITEAVVMSGLEPFDSLFDLISLIKELREKTNDDIVIYTGYKEDEIKNEIQQIIPFGNIVIKYGRYIPNQEPHFDEELGVKLASANQYSVRY